MKLMRSLTLALALTGVSAPFFSGTAVAQAMNGRQLPDRSPVEISYYLVEPGKQDEWVALYLKWHRPIMEEQIKAGVILSSTLYANASHAIQPAFDFAIVNISAPPKANKRMPITRGEVIQKLYPDLDAYTAGERQRWALTRSHWDQDVVEVDLKAANPGVYYPILPAEK